MLLESACSCHFAIYWSQVLIGKWRCIWSNADRRCSNYIWSINNLVAYKGGSYIRDLTVHLDQSIIRLPTPAAFLYSIASPIATMLEPWNSLRTMTDYMGSNYHIKASAQTVDVALSSACRFCVFFFPICITRRKQLPQTTFTTECRRFHLSCIQIP